MKRETLKSNNSNNMAYLYFQPNVKKGWEHATYLAGGASFPSFLALFAQSVIDNPQCLPLRYFVIGRSYENNRERKRFLLDLFKGRVEWVN